MDKDKKEPPKWISNFMLFLISLILIFMFIGAIFYQRQGHTENISNNTSIVNEVDEKEKTDENITNKYEVENDTNFVISRGGTEREEINSAFIEYKVYKMVINGTEVLCFDNVDIANEKKEYLLSNTTGLEVSVNQETTTENTEISSTESIDKIIENYVSQYKKPTKCFPTNSHSISSTYGHRASRGDFHSGIDLSGKYGDNIYAYKAGVVEKIQYSNVSYGNMILINHQDGTKTRYAHLSSINVKTKQNVSCGEIIGHMGSTGNSTGNHLHFEIIINNQTVNPYNYIFK